MKIELINGWIFPPTEVSDIHTIKLETLIDFYMDVKSVQFRHTGGIRGSWQFKNKAEATEAIILLQDVIRGLRNEI